MAYFVPEEETLDRTGLQALQRRKLETLLDVVRKSNGFYRRKLHGLSFDPKRDSVDSLPLTTRAEIEQNQLDHPPYGTNLSEPLTKYTRLHQTSGTGGTPLRWLDTAESWAWFKKCWKIVYRGAGLNSEDRLAFTFSFGPFIGFWAAFEAATDLGNLCLAAGGMTTSARLRYILDHRVTVVCCTPTYALHMAEVAAAEDIDIAKSPVRSLIVAGEPGGNIPETRRRIEAAWGARVFDHAGMTEIGAWGFEPVEQRGGLSVIESEFIAEVIDPATGNPVPDGEAGELVLTNLGRTACPLIRYRTGDQVRLSRDKQIGARSFAWAEGGVLGRIDDMLVVRGNNVFPSTIEGIVREFDGIAEFRLRQDRRGPMTELTIEIEPANGADESGLTQALARRIRDRLHFQPIVNAVKPGTLPRFELKARRVVIDE